MPDVGVLELKIESNATAAAGGLTRLANGLEKAGKNAAAFSLGNVQQQIASIVDAVKDQNTTVKNLGTLINAIAGFKKVEKIKFDAEPFEKLKRALGNGISLGQAGTQLKQLREALDGEWNTANAQTASDALKLIADGANTLKGTGLATITKNVSALAKALDDYAKANERIKAAVGGTVGGAGGMAGAASAGVQKAEGADIGSNITSGAAIGIENNKGEVVRAAIVMAEAIIAAAKNELGIASPSKEFMMIGEYIVEGLIEGIKARKTEIQTVMADLAKSLTGATKQVVTAAGDWRGSMEGIYGGKTGKADTSAIDAIREFANVVQGAGNVGSFAQGLKDINEAIDAGAKSYLTLGRLATSIEKVKKALEGFKIPSFSKLIELAKALQDNYNAETTLKKLAEAMEAMKAASDGFKMPSMKGIEKVVAAVNGTVENKGGQTTTEAIEQLKKDMPEVAAKFADVKQETKEINEGITESIGQAANDIYKDGANALDKQAFSGIVKVFDQVAGAYKEIQVGTEAVSNSLDQTSESASNIVASTEAARESAINLSEIPASGLNGAFASAADELTYLMEKINAAKANMDFWSDTFDKTQKRIKFNGLTEELTNMLKHAEEGFYSSAASVEQYNDILTQTQTKISEYIEGMKQATKEAEAHKAAIQETASAVTGAGNAMSEFTKKAQAAANKAAIDMIFNKLENPPEFKTADYIKQSMGIGAEAKSAEESFKTFLGGIGGDTPQAQHLRETETGMADLKQKMDEAGVAARDFKEKMVDVDGELKLKKKDAKDASQGFTGLQRVLNAFNSVKNVFNNLTKPLRKFGNEIWRIIRRMAIRAVIRQITSGIKEGVENMYWYSKAINSSFAPAMDSAATSLLQMKNSIGAALAPLLQSLIPVLQTVVNWFIEGVNYVNQFFALLNGQSTWTRALPSTTSAFEKQEKATKKASNAIKDLLADWDELNIIQSESGNGADSSGKKAVDYLSMFEEVGTFENRIKKIVDYIKDNFDTIKTVAAGIGAALLAWRVSSALDGVFENVRQLSGGLIMSVIGFTLSADAGARIADEGMTPTAVIEAIGGLAASALGGYWVAAAFFGPVGGIVGGVAGLAIGLGFLVTKFAAKTAENAYGTIEEDADTIRKNVLSYFNPNVEAEVNVLKARLKEEEDAKTKVSDSLSVLEGSYPINVSVNTKETREQLKTDISNLIANTKALILLRKQNIRIPITLSGQYGDADNLVKFSDQQWDKTKAYVENIGKEMGEIISKGITDGARLDELQMKLSKITRAITYGKNSANFAGNISLAGANLRNNGYTQQTVKGYVDTYLSERNNMKAVAEAAAMQEYEELGSLFESVKERYINGDATYDEFKTARDMFNKFNIAAEVNRNLKEWTGTGDEIFGRDLLEGLSKVMETTANLLFQRYDFQRFATEGAFQAGSSDMNAFALQKYLWDTIATETGLKKEKLQEILGLAGINPIDLFPPDFVENIRSGLIEKMERSKYSDEQKREILSALGLSTDNISSSVQKAVGEVQAPAVDDSTFKISLEDIMAKAKETVETAQKYFSWLATPNTTAGLSNMVSATDDAINAIEEKVEELGDYSVKVNTDALRDMINSAFADDYLSGEEKDQIISQFGYKAYQAMLKELGIMFEDGLDWGYRESGGIKPIGMIASNGMTTFARSGVAKVGVGTAQYNPDVLQTSAGFSQTDLANGVEAGTKKANETQNDLIRQLVNIATRIQNKEFTVNVTPNSNWGAHNSKSTAMWESVTGG